MFVPFLLAAMDVITYTEVGQSELRSTVTVSGPCVRDCDRGQVTIGAGEIVDRRADGRLLVLTARHVVERADALTVFMRNGAAPGIEYGSYAQIAAPRSASVVAYAANVDLALVAFSPRPSDDYAFAPFAAGATGMDSAPGVIVGDPNGSLWTVSDYSFLSGDATTFDLACSTCGPGDSGGGVFDASGNLLGIVVQQAVAGTAPSLTQQFQAVGLPELRLFLAKSGASN